MLQSFLDQSRITLSVPHIDFFIQSYCRPAWLSSLNKGFDCLLKSYATVALLSSAAFRLLPWFQITAKKLTETKATTFHGRIHHRLKARQQ